MIASITAFPFEIVTHMAIPDYTWNACLHNPIKPGRRFLFDKTVLSIKLFSYILLQTNFRLLGRREPMSDQVFLESRDEMEELLQAMSFGFLGLSLNGTPYVVPVNYSYANGMIVLHGALEGKKLDFMKTNPRVCFTVGRQVGPLRDHSVGTLCHVDSDSVICYGTARIIEDLEERKMALNAFNRRFRPDAPDVPDVPIERMQKCGVVAIKILKMTGRRERDRKRTHWRYIFQV
jgi:nitroimidazol reductase NimA-like FMN-containing flavoprotein (pyridoxamine 5'-phosphate oxidase superfamily)